ncbi:MAG: hypothetical protein ACE5OV_01770 [Candidatus Bathyarchaeia archaeon]
MKIVIFFMVLLTLSAATIATVAIASNVSLPVPTGQMLEVMALVDSGDVQPAQGDPVGGGGRGPGLIGFA